MKKLTFSQMYKYNTTQKIFEILADAQARAILFSTINEGKTTIDLFDEHRIPLSTIYKKIAELEELVLIQVEKRIISDKGKKFNVYKSQINRVPLMRRSAKIPFLFVITLLSISAIPNFSLIRYIHGEEDHNIPSWISQVARWDIQGKINDSEFSNAVQYLFTQGLLQRESAEELLEMVQPDLARDADDKCWDRNFPKVDWSGCDFSEMDLNHADLAGSNLVGTNFANANLAKAYFVGANLEHANLSHADITNGDLLGADLAGANMSYVNGPFLGTHYANLTNADLTGANLQYSSLNWSIWKGTILKYSNLYGAEGYATDFSGVDFSGADLSMVNFNGANLTNANLDGANLHSANLGGADLTGAKLHCTNNPICK